MRRRYRRLILLSLWKRTGSLWSRSAHERLGRDIRKRAGVDLGFVPVERTSQPESVASWVFTERPTHTVPELKPMSQREVADALGLSEDLVARIETEARRKFAREWQRRMLEVDW